MGNKGTAREGWEVCTRGLGQKGEVYLSEPPRPQSKNDAVGPGKMKGGGQNKQNIVNRSYTSKNDKNFRAHRPKTTRVRWRKKSKRGGGTGTNNLNHCPGEN